MTSSFTGRFAALARRSLCTLALVLSACSGPSKGGDEARESGGEKVPASELPASHRALLEAYGKGGEEWTTARDAALADPALAAFLVDNLVIEMVRAYTALAGSPSPRANPAFERAQSELVHLHEFSAPVLAGMLELPDGVVALLAMRTLERIGRPAVKPVTTLLASPEREGRRRAAETLAVLPHAAGDEPATQAALTALLARDAEWIVRAQAAGAVGARGARDRSTEPARRALSAALNDPDPTVVLAAADALGVLGDPLAVPALIERLGPAAANGDVRVVQELQAALARVSGDSTPRDLAGWRDWWYAHRDELQKSRRVEH
jgi:hypothetical protein